MAVWIRQAESTYNGFPKGTNFVGWRIGKPCNIFASRTFSVCLRSTYYSTHVLQTKANLTKKRRIHWCVSLPIKTECLISTDSSFDDDSLTTEYICNNTNPITAQTICESYGKILKILKRKSTLTRSYHFCPCTISRLLLIKTECYQNRRYSKV